MNKIKPPSVIDYLQVLKQNEPFYSFPKKEKKKFSKQIWKMRLILLKDDWKYSIKPMFILYDPFNFKSEIDKFGNKSTAFSRFKDLVLGVFYILKATFTYLPLGFK